MTRSLDISTNRTGFTGKVYITKRDKSWRVSENAPWKLAENESMNIPFLAACAEMSLLVLAPVIHG